MEKARVLAICPYEGMRELAASLAAAREDISLTAFVGDLHAGLEIAERESASGEYDIIMSRGGTAEMISRSVDVPVLEVPISAGDILQVVKLAENYNEKYAVMGFPGITRSARTVCDLLLYNIDIFTVREQDSVPEKIAQLKREGYTMVLSDQITTTAARGAGLYPLLITSGAESIQNAFTQAVSLCRSYAVIKKRNQLLQEAIRTLGDGALIYSSERELLFSTLESGTWSKKLQDAAQTLAEKNNNGEIYRANKQIGGEKYIFTAKKFKVGQEENTLITLGKPKRNALSPGTGPQYIRRRDIDAGLVDYDSASHSVGAVRAVIEGYCKSNLPIVITGEEGTGKNAAAMHLYLNGMNADRALCFLDCSKLEKKKWNGLIESPDSPFHDIGRAIYLKGVERMSDAMAADFCELLDSTNICRRNSLIASFAISGSIREHPVCQSLTSAHSGLILYMPALRERAADISSLSTIYLNQLAQKSGLQAIGFENGAMRLMTQYSWPENLNQLKRVLRELVTTGQYYITKEAVREVLNKERTLFCRGKQDGQTRLDLNRSLHEINLDIIRLVMERENGSPQKTAARLGISRSTVWRVLNSEKNQSR